MCAVSYFRTYILEILASPTFYPQALLSSPFGGQFTGEGFMEDGRFAGFKTVQYRLGFFFCLVQLGKQLLNAVNNALLLKPRCRWKHHRLKLG